jgi:hypothetical protein
MNGTANADPKPVQDTAGRPIGVKVIQQMGIEDFNRQ